MCCGTRTLAVNPAGESASLVSGAAAIVGWKCTSFSQPVIPTGSSALLCIVTLDCALNNGSSSCSSAFSCCQVPSSSIPNCGGGPHDVGNVNNGRWPSCASSAGVLPVSPFISAWTLPGKPQIVVALNTTLRSGTGLICVVIPLSPPLRTPESKKTSVPLTANAN